MKIHGFKHLICPLDQQPLYSNQQGWQCPHGHQYDRAKQGYVNLLPVQQKKSLQPGDNKDMVRARQHFLDSGYYQPVAQTLSKLVLQHISNKAELTPAYLDAGCGEGYYLQQFVAHASNYKGDQAVAVLGLDISKWAIQAASRRTKQVQWVVGSNAHLPTANASFDVISAVFGFPIYEEFARVLKPGGLLIIVEPNPLHLHELREIIYAKVSHNKPTVPEAKAGFTYQASHPVNFTMQLNNNNDILNLLAMTPHVHRITADALTRLQQLQQLTVTVDMQCVLYHRVAKA
ncbi:putative RNA methyltransferase [Aliidiomarina quisquiliarum]|uniref:putative RNA methyltransferase n=1 Tax=Aliidiomarina quisquiliarum TaxID=2938947 RepID=UPI00208F8C58|nr:methyltransferase domain-containing protein [Aliidiomarina quisquiliarum]MCO4321343.1 methyltransferase domain-containing protein [Aliidiomarina quisquiliarum]